MFSLLPALLASALTAPPSAASITCADGPASCDPAWVAMGGPRPDRDEPRDYATPVEVECPSVGDSDMGECADEAPFDLWYRMSRFAEPDPGGVGAAPARRGPAAKAHASPSCGVPRDVGTPTAHDGPPIALFALPALPPTDGAPDFSPDARGPTARPVAPPERPPRA